MVDVVAPGAYGEDLADPERLRAFYADALPRVYADALPRVYADALPRVYGYFLARCGGNAAAAEDLTQETFLAAVTQIRRGAHVLAPVPWVLGSSCRPPDSCPGRAVYSREPSSASAMGHSHSVRVAARAANAGRCAVA